MYVWKPAHIVVGEATPEELKMAILERVGVTNDFALWDIKDTGTELLAVANEAPWGVIRNNVCRKEGKRRRRVDVSQMHSIANQAQAAGTQGIKTSDEADSDLSDVEDEGYMNLCNTDNIYINLDLKHCTKQSVTHLYCNPHQVYRMANGVRGRVLIIDNLFRDNPRSRRPGSSVDYTNVKRLFEELNFEIAKTEEDLTDLTAEEMLEEIREETKLDVHRIYSMFVLIVMSHGSSSGRMVCHDNKYIDITTITKLLSASKFPAMKGKPKLVIIQACSGGQRDWGDSRHSEVVASSAMDSYVTPPNDRIKSATPAPTDDVTTLLPTTFHKLSNATTHSSTTHSATTHSAPSYDATISAAASNDVTLDADDFFIMKSSTESYGSTRSCAHGSPFIRILVATFYKHACHRDLESLFKIIRQRVREYI